MKRAIFYHAGCPVCLSAEQQFVSALDPKQYAVEVVHLAQSKERLAEADQAGVKSVPALVIDGQVFHINYGASLNDLREGVWRRI